jgi:predicted SAM-dependent methyltransferase
MKNLINKILRKFGYLIVSKRTLRKHPPEAIEQNYEIEVDEIIIAKSLINGGIKEKLVTEGRTHWLEVGSGGTFDQYFTYIDLFPETILNRRGRYHRIDIVNLSESEANVLGKFDLIRMQHVFEHFTPEDGLQVLNNCSRLLKHDGYILISSPDLKKYISLYLSGKISNDFEWALKRIETNSPDSFYFSIYSHSMKYEKHEWCYDAEGIIYQIGRTGKFKNIKEIKLGDNLANIPFTHNRPKEDVCVIAQLI